MNASASRRHMTREEREERALLSGKNRLPRTLKQFEDYRWAMIALWLLIAAILSVRCYHYWMSDFRYGWFWSVAVAVVMLRLMRIIWWCLKGLRKELFRKEKQMDATAVR